MDITQPEVCAYDDWEEVRPDVIQIYANHTLKELVKILRSKYKLKPNAT
jgi:hypothetical protein